MQFDCYAFQIHPSHDDELLFSETMDDCYAGALEHWADIKVHHPDLARSGGLPVYRCRMMYPDAATMLQVMNSVDQAHRILYERCLVERKLVARVSD
jgi:hypothetical protein